MSLTFDDGFRDSFVRTAEIHEKLGLSACLNVLATGESIDAYMQGVPVGDFALWNELQRRGHEIMPHGYRHENLAQMPLPQAQDLVRKTLDVFAEKLDGFRADRAVFNLPYNSSTPELEGWLVTQVRAFRTGGASLNPFPAAGVRKVTCTSFGPGRCDDAIETAVNQLLKQPTGWMVFNTHGLDNEGWGPVSSAYLEKLLNRLLETDSVEVIPVGRALAKYGFGKVEGLKT